MHLGYSTSTDKGRTYRSYTIAESRGDGKSVRKRVSWRLGKLTDQQAEQIKLILEVMQGEDQVATRLKHIAVQETRAVRAQRKLTSPNFPSILSQYPAQPDSGLLPAIHMMPLSSNKGSS